jgi:hypothetical protein
MRDGAIGGRRAWLGALTAFVCVTWATHSRAAETANPQSDDGNAVRLRVDLGLDVSVFQATSAAGGGYGGIYGYGFGPHLRVGAQIKPWLAVSYQGELLLPANDTVLNKAFWNSAEVEATFKFFQFGVGPSVDVITLGVPVPNCSAPCGTTIPGANAASAFFGGDGHIGVALRDRGPGRHVGFAASLNGHLDFLSGGALMTVSQSIGLEWY